MPGLRERVFVDFDPRWIVHRDEHVVVVDKPAGMLSIEREPGAASALVTRLAHHLGLTRPLAVLSRLDQETSGLVVFPLSEEAVRSLARQAEDRRLEKRYLAAVSSRPGAPLPSGRLEDVLLERDGRAEVRSGRPGGEAKTAISEVRVRARHGARALLEVRLETGRMHQIRAQLAHRGAPVGGDPLYGGELAPRLLLHSSSLALTHPARGPMRFESPAPACFESWARGALTPEAALEVALLVAIERRHGLGHAEDGERATTAFRLFSESGDGAPGLAIDVYGEHLVVHLHDIALAEGPLLDRLHGLGFRGIYLKRRPKKAQDLSASDLEVHAPSVPVRGEPVGGGAAPDELVVHENGMPFLVRLGDGMSTGLFLDQRSHRARVRALSAGKRVLNLFAYTCGFTVAAALGGAASTTSVDASRRALDRGRQNLALSGLDGPAHSFVADDAFEVLARLAKRGERFEVICVDPPTFSTTRTSRWTSGKDWQRLASLVLSVLAEGGSVIATSNDRRMSQGAFRDHLRAGASQAGVVLSRLVDLEPPLDFRAGPGENPLLKGLLAERA